MKPLVDPPSRPTPDEDRRIRTVDGLARLLELLLESPMLELPQWRTALHSTAMALHEEVLALDLLNPRHAPRMQPPSPLPNRLPIGTQGGDDSVALTEPVLIGTANNYGELVYWAKWGHPGEDPVLRKEQFYRPFDIDWASVIALNLRAGVP